MSKEKTMPAVMPMALRNTIDPMAAVHLYVDNFNKGGVTAMAET